MSIKLFDSQSKKEWNNRLNYLYNIVTPQWTRVYKRNIPVNKEDGRLYMIIKFYPVGSILFDKGLTGELYIGFNNKKCYKVLPAWKSGDLDSEKYGKKFAGIKCVNNVWITESIEPDTVVYYGKAEHIKRKRI